MSSLSRVLSSSFAAGAFLIAASLLPFATVSAQQFTVGSSTTVPQWPARLAAGDFDEDGFQDLAVASPGSPTGVFPPPEFFTILFGNGAGDFGTSLQLFGGERPYAVEVVDFDGDANLDVIACDLGDFFTSDPDSVYVYFGDGTGDFEAPLIVTPGDKPVAVAVGDYDEDTHLDFAVACGGSQHVVVYFGDGLGGIDSETTLPLDDYTSDLATADLDEDGHLDLVATYSGDPLNGNGNQIAVMLGDGLGAFGLPVLHEVNGGPNSLVIADFDEDDNLDVAVTNFGGFLGPNDTLSLVFGDGNGAFSPPSTTFVGDGPFDLIAADFDADGHLDLAVSVFGDFFGASGDTVWFLEGTGDGTFPTMESYTISGGLSGLVVTDLNNDVAGDLVVGNATGDTIHVLLNTGGAIGDAPFIRGDANGDGVFNGLTDALYVLAYQFTPGSPPPPCLEAADADNDGIFNGLIDALVILNFQFIPGSPPPPPPYPECGFDDDEALGCLVSPMVCL